MRFAQKKTQTESVSFCSSFLRIGLLAVFLTSHSALAIDVGPGKFSKAFREMSDAQLEEVNRQVNEVLKIPFFFVMPEDSLLKMSSEDDQALDRINSGQWLRAPVFVFTYNYLFPFPSAGNSENKLSLSSGLRLIIADGNANRESVTRRLLGSGLLKAGDIVLSFRPEWAGTGAYPHIQLGVSHAGVIYTEGDTAYNLDMPLDATYNGPSMESALNSPHYKKATMVHIMRPRLTDQQRANVNAWTKLIKNRASKIYKNGISFNMDYQAPKYDESAPESERMGFVADLARLALGVSIAEPTSMYCSEFAWSILSLRDCSPSSDGADFKSGVPSCIKPIFQPLATIGNVSWSVDQVNAEIGSTDGPLQHLAGLVEALPYDDEVRADVVKTEIENIFKISPQAPKMSAGHSAVADTLGDETFGKIETFFKTVYLGSPDPRVNGIDFSEKMRQGFNSQMKRNYSPTAFVLQSILTPVNRDKAVDYVGTIVFASDDEYKKLRKLTKN